MKQVKYPFIINYLKIAIKIIPKYLYSQFEEEEELKREIASKPADFLAPYLVPYKLQDELTPEQSLYAYNACLNDLKSRFVSLLNNLQRHYEDVSAKLYIKTIQLTFTLI